MNQVTVCGRGGEGEVRGGGEGRGGGGQREWGGEGKVRGGGEGRGRSEGVGSVDVQLIME